MFLNEFKSKKLNNKPIYTDKTLKALFGKRIPKEWPTATGQFVRFADDVQRAEWSLPPKKKKRVIKSNATEQLKKADILEEYAKLLKETDQQLTRIEELGEILDAYPTDDD